MSDDPRQTQQVPEDELVPEDDAIIGRVFRWSLLVIALAAIIVLALLALTRKSEVAETVLEKSVGDIADLEPELDQMPRVRFTDVTASSGIGFVHESGARGAKLLPESMGSGAAFFDRDGDGDPDLLLVNGMPWPGDSPEDPATPALYDNDGLGGFTEVTREAGLDFSLYGMGVAVGDYDADGDSDLYLTAVGPNRLLRNDGGRFTDVTGRAGVAGGPTDWGSSTGFLDYDNDGDLDLFVCNYVRWSRSIDEELAFSLNGRDRAYGPPTNYEGSHPYLYRNDGEGRFSDVSAEAGIQVSNPATGSAVAKALGVYFVDIDADGFIDIFLANDTVQNFLFHNQGDGTFKEIGTVAGVGFDSAGNATGAMGIDAAHHRNDHQLAVGMGNFANEMSSLYVSQRSSLQFTDESAGEGIGSPSRLALSFGLFFFDYDLDGRLDMLQANGHLEEEINQVQESQHYRQPAQLFWNSGPESRSCFVEVPGSTVGDLSRPIVGRGATFADIDADGDLDVLLTQTGGPPLLLRNDQTLGHDWLRVELTGRAGSRDAIGAWVELESNGQIQRRQLMPTRSYLSQVEPVVTFGLAAGAPIDRLTVVWRDGSRQEVPSPGRNRRIRIEQPG